MFGKDLVWLLHCSDNANKRQTGWMQVQNNSLTVGGAKSIDMFLKSHLDFGFTIMFIGQHQDEPVQDYSSAIHRRHQVTSSLM